jgi:hypothetical protein
MFNFYTLQIFVIIIALWFFCSSILIQTHDLYYNFNDLSTRLWFNEFFFNMYYFYWTSFWYLVAIIVATKLVFVLVYVRRPTFKLLMLTSLLFIYTNTINEYYGYNLTHTNFLKYEYQTNSLLTNSINKYHPFIFYFTLTWVYIVNIYTNVYIRYNSFPSTYKKQYLIKNLNYFIPLIYLTLGLGSWWALQEGSWGGWWNWDSSEVFGLLVMLFYLHLTHKKSWSVNKQSLKLWGNIFLSILVSIYILIQLNFDLVSHNFGTKINQFINPDQFLYVLLVLTVVKAFGLICRLLKNTNHYLNTIKLKNLSTKVLLFTCLVLTIILLSFTELVNNFIWLLLKINTINIINWTVYYTPLTLLILHLFITRTNLIFLVTFFHINHSLGSLYLLCNSVNNVTKTYNLHSVVYMFLLVTYTCINQSLIDWAYIVNNTYTFVNQYLVDLYTPFLKINTSYIELTSTHLLNNQITSSGWNFIQWSTNQQAHTFQHSMSASLILQGLYNSLFEYIHNICVIDYNSQTLAMLTLLWFISLKDIRKSKIIILF